MTLKYLHPCVPPGQRTSVEHAALLFCMPTANTRFEVSAICSGLLSCEKRINAWSVCTLGSVTCREPVSVVTFWSVDQVAPLSLLNASVLGPVLGLLRQRTVDATPAANSSQP